MLYWFIYPMNDKIMKSNEILCIMLCAQSLSLMGMIPMAWTCFVISTLNQGHLMSSSFCIQYKSILILLFKIK